MSDELLPAAVLGPTCHRFLSPHYDDIALSCGGTVALLSERGLAPEIEVLFGEGPAAGAALSPFAAENLRDWGLTAVEATAVRRQEERTAAGVLGATTSWLPFPDAIYRDRHYLNNEQLFGEPVAVEGELPEGLIAGLELSEADRAVTRLYAPLAVGGHVDHRHAFRAGRALAIAGWDVWFYEDLPYALRPGLLEDRLAAIGPELVPAAVVPIGPVWETKLAAIFAYPSQLARTFSFAGSNGSRDDIARLLDGYARRIGGGERAERFWRLGGPGSISKNESRRGIDKRALLCYCVRTEAPRGPRKREPTGTEESETGGGAETTTSRRASWRFGSGGSAWRCLRTSKAATEVGAGRKTKRLVSVDANEAFAPSVAGPIR